MNTIHVIHPYKDEGQWVFDDDRFGLVKEPFVAGADDLIDEMVRDLDGADKGFTLLFSRGPFPGYQAEFQWRREEFDGSWYYSAQWDKEGWLCPALFHYFDAAPPTLYVQVRK